MLKKLKRRIKEKLKRLPYGKITVIQIVAYIIDIIYLLFDLVVFIVIFGAGVLLIVAMVAAGYISSTAIVVSIIAYVIICLLNLCAKKVNKICDEVILEKSNELEIKCYQLMDCCIQCNKDDIKTKKELALILLIILAIAAIEYISL